MAAKDFYHNKLKNALIKEGWLITHDPYIFDYLWSRQWNHRIMDKLSTYSNYVVELLETYLHPGLESPIHEHLVIDREHHHYQFLREGWVDKNTFQMGIVLHFQIKADGKIWILANWTEDDVAGELVERGVLKQDIVLAFQPESVRKLSGYAAAWR